MAEKKSKQANADGIVQIAENRRARYDFEIGDTLECGIELVGAEVKSLRMKAVSFADAFAEISNGQLWLHSVKIDRYRQSNIDIVEPSRRRRLLANAKEIEKFRRLTAERGYTLIPLKLYFKGPWAKCLIGLAKGKTKGDKRETI
ncbi:MAG TPA: SsrA-binding protein SmpB, partial [Myxococcota bacterium]